MSDTSRDPDDLHPALREAWEYLRDEWGRRYIDSPQPFLTCTYRGPDDQAKHLASGASTVPFGGSMHNYKPAYAFDVAFDDDLSDGVGNDLTWTFIWYERLGEMAEEIGLVWGGRWPKLVDGPHFQLDAKPKDAELGRVPKPPKLPVREISKDEWAVVVMKDGRVAEVFDLPAGADVVMRYARAKKRVYVDMKREDS